jgi:murein L,D-transpeptidase YafK
MDIAMLPHERTARQRTRRFLVVAAATTLVWLLLDMTAGAWRGHGWSDPWIVIRKGQRILELHQNGGVVKTYRVCLGLSPEGPKKVTGDKKTPEGEYFICYKSAESSYHRFLGISYPGEEDARAAFQNGLISLDRRDEIISSVKNRKTPPWNTALGGWVGIHGYPSDDYKHRWISLLYPKPDNWTDGCVAMWSFEIEELYSRVPVGTPVLIYP